MDETVTEEIAVYVEVDGTGKDLATIIRELTTTYTLPLVVKVKREREEWYALFADKGGHTVAMKMTPNDVWCSFCRRLTIQPYVMFRPRGRKVQHVALCYVDMSVHSQIAMAAGWSLVSFDGKKAYPLPIRGVTGIEWAKGYELPGDWNRREVRQMKVREFVVGNSPWARKQLWFDALAFIVLVAAAFGYTGEVSKETAELAGAIVAIVNFATRWWMDRQQTMSMVKERAFD